VCPEKCRQVGRDAFEDRFPELAFLALALKPLTRDLLRRLKDCAAEDVRMPGDQFLTDRIDDITHVKLAPVLRDLCLKDDLQEEVAQLLPYLGGVAFIEGLEELIGLFEEIGLERVPRLHPVPRTAILATEPGHYVDELLQVSHGVEWSLRARRSVRTKPVLPGQDIQDLLVARRGLAHDVVGQPGSRVGLVPGKGQEVVSHNLLVEAVLASAGLIVLL